MAFFATGTFIFSALATFFFQIGIARERRHADAGFDPDHVVFRQRLIIDFQHRVDFHGVVEQKTGRLAVGGIGGGFDIIIAGFDPNDIGVLF